MFQEKAFREDVEKMMDAYQSGVGEGNPVGHLDLNVYSKLRDFTFDHAGDGSTDAKLAKTIQDIEETRGVPFEHIPRALIQAMPDDEPMKQELVNRNHQNVLMAQGTDHEKVVQSDDIVTPQEEVKSPESASATSLADKDLDMACDALSKIHDVPNGIEGEQIVGAMLLRVKNSVNERLYGQSGKDNPPPKNEAFGIMLQVKDAFTAGVKGAGAKFDFAFKDTLNEITTEVGTFMAARQIKESFGTGVSDQKNGQTKGLFSGFGLDSFTKLRDDSKSANLANTKLNMAVDFARNSLCDIKPYLPSVGRDAHNNVAKGFDRLSEAVKSWVDVARENSLLQKGLPNMMAKVSDLIDSAKFIPEGTLRNHIDNASNSIKKEFNNVLEKVGIKKGMDAGM